MVIIYHQRLVLFGIKYNREGDFMSSKKFDKPVCLVCDKCDRGTSNAKLCILTGEDVSREHFALSSPESCPKRKEK